MKKLLFISILLLSLVGYTQEKQLDTISNLEITKAERIIDKYSSKIAESFNEGLNKITPIAEEGFRIAVKLQIAKGIAGLIPVLTIIICIIILYKLDKYEWFGRSDPTSYGIYAVITIIFLIISIITTCMTITDTIGRLYAPEWYAIKEIIELF